MDMTTVLRLIGQLQPLNSFSSVGISPGFDNGKDDSPKAISTVLLVSVDSTEFDRARVAELTQHGCLFAQPVLDP